jgi:hypothetical protein
MNTDARRHIFKEHVLNRWKRKMRAAFNENPGRVLDMTNRQDMLMKALLDDNGEFERILMEAMEAEFAAVFKNIYDDHPEGGTIEVDRNVIESAMRKRAQEVLAVGHQPVVDDNNNEDNQPVDDKNEEPQEPTC